MTTRKISDSTVRRLSHYLRILRELARSERTMVSSRELARSSGTTAAQVRKDLSHFGSFGKRGRGYAVSELERRLVEILGLGRRWKVAVIGVGRIGGALLGYGDLDRRGFEIVAAFDTDPAKVGRSHGGVPIHPLDDLERVLKEQGVEIGIVATPPEAAQEVTRRLERAGVEGILNFAPVKLEAGPDVRVRTMDVTLELEGLSFALGGGANGAER